jgi:CBS domain-containing protein
MRTQEIMQSNVLTVSSELPVAELETILTGEEISGAPVVDPNGELIGVVSQSDVIRALSQEASTALRDLLTPDLTVDDIMTRKVLTVTMDDDARQVARKLLDAGVHRAVVVDDDGVCGIVTSLDLLRLIV